MSEDLSTPDGNALVARRAVVKARVVEDNRSLAGEFGTGDDDCATDRADTEAVLDERAIRLLLETGGEVARLRGLIRAAVRYIPDDYERPLSCTYASAGWRHRDDSPWPALVAGAEKP